MAEDINNNNTGIENEADKRVNQALKTQQKKYEKQLTLSQLDGEAREKAEKDNKIAELEEKLAAFQIEKNKWTSDFAGIEIKTSG